MAVFTVISIVAGFIGSALCHKLDAEYLKKGFGGFLVFVASYMLFKSVF